MCDTAAVHLGVEPLIHFDSGDGFVMVVVITRPQKIRVVEELILFVFITLLHGNSVFVKFAAQIVILVLNYIISKIFVFKNKK